MVGGGYETGWLELKAIEFDPNRVNGEATIVKADVEPSQIFWIESHYRHCPVHFLFAVGDCWFLIDGRWAQEIKKGVSIAELKRIAIKAFHRREAREELSATLRNLTHRGRYGLQGV
jgi:hypothetical protein